MTQCDIRVLLMDYRAVVRYRHGDFGMDVMTTICDDFQPGQRVVVTQQIPQRDEVWTARTEGVVQQFEQKKTGAWYAHAKDDKLWLDRLTILKDDGEVTVCVLDTYTRVEVVQ